MLTKVEAKLEQYKLYRGFKIAVQVLACILFFVALAVGPLSSIRHRTFSATATTAILLGVLLAVLAGILIARYVLAWIMSVSRERPENMVWRFAHDLAEFLNDILCLVWSFLLLFGLPLGLLGLLLIAAYEGFLKR